MYTQKESEKVRVVKAFLRDLLESATTTNVKCKVIGIHGVSESIFNDDIDEVDTVVYSDNTFNLTIDTDVCRATFMVCGRFVSDRMPAQPKELYDLPLGLIDCYFREVNPAFYLEHSAHLSQKDLCIIEFKEGSNCFVQGDVEYAVSQNPAEITAAVVEMLDESHGPCIPLIVDSDVITYIETQLMEQGARAVVS